MLPPAKHPHPKWLADAIFYEIYPQSFVDSNGDGIGDIPGITLKLDYIKDLGCNAIWLNPCFDSPFKDAGYDVRDYKKVASRYTPARNTSGSTAVARSSETIIPTATSGQTHGSPVATDCHSSAANRPATVPTS